MKRLMSWEPFVTEGGYMGLSREGSSVGDEIWVIGGFRTPIRVGRPRESRHRVQGEVCLDGFMFGELGSDGSATLDSAVKPIVLV